MPAPSQPIAIPQISNQRWEQMQFFLYLSTAIEAAAALLIGVAAVRSLVQSIPLLLLRKHESVRKQDVRLELGLWLSLALELAVGADRLRTVCQSMRNGAELRKMFGSSCGRFYSAFFLKMGGKVQEEELDSCRAAGERRLGTKRDEG